MERFEHNMVRMSHSPRQRPHITHGVQSPIQSVHPEINMESIHSRADLGHRTADFFDPDTSDEESPVHGQTSDGEIGLAIDGPRGLNLRKRRSGNCLGGTTDQFNSNCAKQTSSPTPLQNCVRYTPSAVPQAEQEGDHSAESSFLGSVAELTVSDPPRRTINLHNISTRLETRLRHSSAPEHDDDSLIFPKQRNSSQILAAHGLTLQALLKNGKVHNNGDASNERNSRKLDPFIHALRHRSASAPAKKISMVPPPKDLSTAKSLAQDLHIKTPYPFSPLPSQNRKRFEPRTPLSPSTIASAHIPTDSILTLSIARTARHPSSRPRIATLTIPSNTDFTTIKSASTNEKDAHFASLDFDDAAFFSALRTSHRHLLGPFRHFSARGLARIEVAGSASRAADAGYGWLHAPRSPRALAYRGLSDTFSEEKLLRHFRKPGLGKARYAWVGWAHRLAAAPLVAVLPPPPPPPPPSTARTGRGSAFGVVEAGVAEAGGSMVRRQEQHEGLDFVMAWSVFRILIVLAGVLLLSVAAALLWIFLGRSAVPITLSSDMSVRVGGGATTGGVSGGMSAAGDGSGFRDAGDRVGTGVLIGICVLLFGLTGMGGWIGVSWLIW